MSTPSATGTTADAPYYLGIDVGGTNLKAGVVSDDGESLSNASRPTAVAEGRDVGLRNLFDVAQDAVDQSGLTFDDIAAIGLATPGTMDIPAGMLLRPHNLPGWEDLPIRRTVADHFGKPTVLQNDANAAAYGEYWAGAGRDASSLVFWTLGTGIGCGIIVADMIIQGEHSHGSECGHIIIEMSHGRPCPSGQFGTLEAYASAKSLVARCEEALDTGHESVLADWVANGEELTPLLIARAADGGDDFADELIMDTARYLGIGTTSLMHTIDPNMVLFGGAMTFGRHEHELGRRFLKRIKDEVRIRAFPVPYENTIIDYATLGGDAGYIGAAGCARRELRQTK